MADAGTTRSGPLAAAHPVAIAVPGPATRLSVRGGAEAARRIGGAFGVELPGQALRAGEAGERAALWLGPDEWLLMAPLGEEALAGTLGEALGGEPGCVVDVSHRQAALELTGAGATAALNAGCPLDLDLSAFPVGTSTRTVLAKADIVLWRRGPERFHVECWRSFAPYVFAFLRQAAADNAA